MKAKVAVKRPGRVAAHGIRHHATSWLLRHAQVFLYSLGQLSRQPFGSLLTASVIGITLALPAGLHVLLGNAQVTTRGWDSHAHITLYLRIGVDDSRAARLADDIGEMPEVAQTRLITRTEALAEFRTTSGFGDVLDALDSNPLPAVIIVRPQDRYAEPAGVGRLVTALQKREEIELAQFNLQWVKRLYAMMAIVQRGVLVLAGLLSVAVLLIVGNTIRLSIHSRRAEIEVAKLFGATDAFIRRPFLYSGLWYGLAGGLIALALVNGSVNLLGGPVGQLAELYYSDFSLAGLDAHATMAVIAGGASLGLGGSWLAVGRHLRAIEPT